MHFCQTLSNFFQWTLFFLSLVLNCTLRFGKKVKAAFFNSKPSSRIFSNGYEGSRSDTRAESNYFKTSFLLILPKFCFFFGEENFYLKTPLVMQQHFLTIPLEVFFQKSDIFGSKSERKTVNDFVLETKYFDYFLRTSRKKF